MAGKKAVPGFLAIVALVAALSGCFGQQPAIVTVVATSNGNPLAGVAISIDDEAVGSTAADGTITIDVPTNTPTTVAASKKFFVTPEVQSVSVEDAEATVEINLDPYVFVPNPLGDPASIVRLAKVDEPFADWDILTAAEFSGGTHTFNSPLGVYVDYENGYLHILDSQADEFTTLIRLSDFPPAADGSDAEVADLTDGEVGVQLAPQAVILDAGNIVLPNYYDAQLYQVPASLDYGSSTTSAFFSPPRYIHGLTLLPDGRILMVGTGSGSPEPHLLVIDDVNDTTPESFPSVDPSTGSGDNQFHYPIRAAATETHVYVSDTGASGSFDNNSRLVRYNIDGTAFTTYGSRGSGEGQFDNPLILGVLPDNRLYIMDAANGRLVRINLAAFDGGAPEWVESAASFNFEYYYNYS